MEMTRIQCLRKFFEKDAVPITTTEMFSFWKSLSEQEKVEYSEAAAMQLGVTVRKDT